MSTPTPVTLEQRVAALEAKVETEGSKVIAFFKTNWGHFVTWVLVTVGPAIAKHL